MSRKMKDSGVEWIGEIPEEWSVVRMERQLKHCAKTSNDDRLLPLSLSFGKVIPKATELPESTLIAYQKVNPGQIVINPLNLNYDLKSIRVGMVNQLGAMSTGYIVMDPYQVNASYITFLLKAFDQLYMKSLGAGVRQTVSYALLSKCFLIAPPLSEQQAIADYLDTKVEEIDTNISKLKSASALLSELKQSVIYEAVTGKTFEGKVIDRKMKDSGVEWIGEIPEGWGLHSLRKVLIEKSVRNKSLPVASQSYLSVGGGRVYTKNTEENKLSDNVQEYKYVEKSDFVLGIRAWQGSFGIAPHAGLVSPAYRTYTVSELNGGYLAYLMNTYGFKTELTAISKGICTDQWKVCPYKFKSIFLYAPPLSEQQAIADYLDRKVGEIDNKISIIERKIELLAELKQSVIYEAVTGKIDVRSHVRDDTSLAA